jgi:hypothetical protein
MLIIGTLSAFAFSGKNSFYQGYDVNKLSNSVTSQLNTALSLTKDQEQQVLKCVTGFLTEKAKFVSLSNTDKATYQQKQAALFDGLKHKMAGILLMGQTNKFLALKPAANDASNALSILFY